MRNIFTYMTVTLGGALLVAGSVVVPATAAPLDDPNTSATVEPTTTDENSNGDTSPTEPTPATDEPVRPGTTSSDVVSISSSAAAVNGGLQRVRLYSGSLSWSVDGLGINEGSRGNLQVEKPAGAAVAAAFLMTAGSSPHANPTDITLGGSAVSFSLEAGETVSDFGFTNFFADVTSIVKPLVDPQSGTINIEVNEGAFADQIEGTSLVVVFDDPAVSLSSIAIYFGTSDPAGDTFTMAFNALAQPQTQDLRMSIGSAYSYGSDQNTRVLVNGQILSEYAGHFDDCDVFVAGEENEDNWVCNDRSLLTVGGVGDSLENPAMSVGGAWSTVADDELYSLAPFVTVGDTEITVVTSNASADDNIFMTVFYLDEIEIAGAERISATLAHTGPAQSGWLFGAGAALLVLGMALAVASRRRAQHSL